MPTASILIKPSSANCNIDCKYCFYKCLSSNREEYSKGFMTDETLEKLIIQAIDYAEDYLAFAFQGGEPTLIGIEFFEKAAALQKKHNHKHLTIENTIQTNGILIDERWAEFFARNHFLVGLSLDGPKKIHDHYRVDVQGNPTFVKVMHTVSLFEQYHVDYNILSVITDEAAKKASYMYQFYKRNRFSYVQLIPCMDEQKRDVGSNKDEHLYGCAASQRHEPLSGHGVFQGHEQKQGTQKENISGTDVRNGQFAVGAEGYGKFLCEIFDLWYADFCNGLQMDIRMFSNLAQMAAGYPPEECGMCGQCNCYFVVEGDGSVYPCDFYCMDEWKLGTVEDSFKSMIGSDKAKEFVEMSLGMAGKCKACPYVKLCRGGCRRWREPLQGESGGLNQLCGAYEIFFEHTWDRIQKLGQYIRKKYCNYRN